LASSGFLRQRKAYQLSKCICKATKQERKASSSFIFNIHKQATQMENASYVINSTKLCVHVHGSQMEKRVPFQKPERDLINHRPYNLGQILL